MDGGPISRAIDSMIFPTEYKLALVNEWIAEFEGTGKAHDTTRWGKFMDIKGIKEEMLARLDAEFEQWLNP